MSKFLGRNNFFRSIRFYIILLVVVAGTIPSLMLTASILQNYESRAISANTNTIIYQTQILVNKLLSGNYYSESTDNVDLEEQVDLLANYYDGRIMIIDGNYMVIYDTYDMDEGKIVVSKQVFSCFEGTETSNYDSANHYIEVAVPVISDDDTCLGAVLISVSSSEIESNILYLRNNAVVISSAMLLLILFIAFFGSYRLVRPFQSMSDSIDQIQMDYENEELQIMDYTETENLSKAFNEMLSRMKTLDDSRQEFVSNVSHELKTPLASMKVLADSLLNQDDVPVEYYREFMTDIAEEIDRENEIINDLLSLVKMDKTTGVLNISQVSINELVELTIKRLKPLLEEKNIELVFENLRPVTAQIDEVKMTLVITNLVENAIKYNTEGGWVHVTLNADNQFFYLKVEDSGIGIAQEDLGQVFERFYRADKSHSKEISGTGLGLAIVRNAVLMHRGAIQVDSTVGKGSTFSIRIPLEYIA